MWDPNEKLLFYLFALECENKIKVIALKGLKGKTVSARNETEISDNR